MTGKSRQQPRHAIWLSQEALVAAQRLSEATGLSMEELIEIVLFGVSPEELRLDKPPGVVPAKAAARAPRARPSPAQVIPIAQARAHRNLRPHMSRAARREEHGPNGDLPRARAVGRRTTFDAPRVDPRKGEVSP